MRVFITKGFARFSRRERIGQDRLREAVERAERGLIDADLGGGVVKQRVARRGQGRSGGYRVLVVYRPGQRAIFLYGFAKSERDNIDADELVRLRRAAQEMMAWSEEQVAAMLAAGEWIEVEYGDKKDEA